jgi:hypothetical protein
MSRVSDERVARNDAVFRDANERIRDAAVRHDVSERIPFLCECADERCSEIVRLSLAEYEAVREDATRFVNAPDHHLPFARSERLVERRDGYDVVEKTGAAAGIVEELDPRKPDT